MHILRRTLSALLLCLIVSACGAKGDLYLPEQAYPQPAEGSK